MLSSAHNMQSISVSRITFAKYWIANPKRCWITPGSAIRISQSIGMHTEEGSLAPLVGCVSSRSETRRRLWYSLYVLDRLLALQLGRPPTIHDDDCHLALPSRVDDAAIDWTMDRLPENSSEGPSVGDYFVHVIGFSKILGLVLRDLYGAKKSKQEELISTKQLDNHLSKWKRDLPRVLIFDIGHAFEELVVLQETGKLRLAC